MASPQKRSAAYLQKHIPRAELSAQKQAVQLTKYTVNSNGCWIWTGSFFKDGYGQMKRNGKNLKAHRVFFEAHKGPIPEGLCVLHKCDTPACVNPEHLWAGTNLQNIQDRDRKNRTHQTYVEHIDQTVNIRKMAQELGVVESSLRNRFKRGWSFERAVSQPFNVSSSKRAQAQIAKASL